MISILKKFKKDDIGYWLAD